MPRRRKPLAPLPVLETAAKDNLDFQIAKIREQLCDARKDTGHSQASLAHHLGCAVNTVQRAEMDYNGQHARLKNMALIANALGYELRLSIVPMGQGASKWD